MDIYILWYILHRYRYVYIKGEIRKEKAIKKAFIRVLSVFLAFLTVVSPQASLLSVVGELSVEATEDGNANNLNSVNAGKNHAIVTEIAVTGSGIQTDKGQNVADVIVEILCGTDNRITATYYSTLDDAKASNASLVVYACGTAEAAAGIITVDSYIETLSSEVNALKALGKDVVLVGPGPVIAYGSNGFYSDNSIFTPENVAKDINIYNAVNDFSNAVKSAALSCNVGVISIVDKASLYGVDTYMKDSQDGLLPENYDPFALWIAEYISEKYIIAAPQNLLLQTVISNASAEKTAEFSQISTNFNTVVISVPANTTIPANITVQTSKTSGDWNETVATVANTDDGKLTCTITFDDTVAKYVRIFADGDFPANTNISFYAARISSPVITSPVNGQTLNTKQSFNIEWSDVAGADKYIVTINHDYRLSR